ncbi:Ribonuclease D [Geosmithia morbida]|uniref:Ribonuclease D n=1 Tax=Geosmithia morbida TaxID=1094350 RepID=A0A9P5CYJ3_9HYPO|nr:Ribonuclease D [Geosmithia morbida]KAF4120498.1 Ribonuclease D [Geosmithia morbida]
MAFNDAQLWSRSMGIRFAPSLPPGPPTKPPLYPPPHPVSDAASQNGATPLQPGAGRQQKQQQQQPTPPPTSLPYKISPESFARARASPRGTPGSYWSHTMYRGGDAVDGSVRSVTVHYCKSRQSMETVCEKYFAGEPILGFDLEWSPRATKAMGPRQNVSLIQLASAGRIGLFHCAVFVGEGDFVGPTFRKIMGDPAVTKVGVAIKADCTRMNNYLGVESRGIMELSHMYKMVKYQRQRRPDLINKSLVTLATQVEECLGLPLYKGDSVRSSDWTRYLNARQISYSAADAYAGIQLYHALDEQRRSLDPCPPLPFYAELNLPLPVPDLGITNIPADETSASSSPSQKTRPARSPAAPIDGIKFRDDRATAAHHRMQQYRSSKRGPVSTGPSALRAYYMWHDNAELDPQAIARILRDPPLQTHTVVSYILSAVIDEGLSYDKDRVKRELLSTLKPDVFKVSRYQALKESCES